ncbi:thioredoxin [Lachnospiraceae bacterium 46-15]
MAMELRNDNFKEEVLESEIPVLVDFWADWCGPCKMVAPIIEEIAEELTDVKVGKVNVDEQPELAAEYRIMSIPTLMVFKDGAAANKAVGAMSKGEILNLLK